VQNVTFFSNSKIRNGSSFTISVIEYIQNNWLIYLFLGKNMIQDQNVSELDIQNLANKNLTSSTENTSETVSTKEEKHSKIVEKNQKIYSVNDSKKFEDILFRHIEKMNEKTITRNQLLTQHKKTLLELFSLGATVEEVVTFLKENNFTSISEENLKEFLKKKK
jgi:LAS superfamily LD-carboxypeptidase LdcB